MREPCPPPKPPHSAASLLNREVFVVENDCRPYGQTRYKRAAPYQCSRTSHLRTSAHTAALRRVSIAQRAERRRAAFPWIAIIALTVIYHLLYALISREWVWASVSCWHLFFFSWRRRYFRAHRNIHISHLARSFCICCMQRIDSRLLSRAQNISEYEIPERIERRPRNIRNIPVPFSTGIKISCAEAVEKKTHLLRNENRTNKSFAVQHLSWWVANEENR